MIRATAMWHDRPLIMLGLTSYHLENLRAGTPLVVDAMFFDGETSVPRIMLTFADDHHSLREKMTREIEGLGCTQVHVE